MKTPKIVITILLIGWALFAWFGGLFMKENLPFILNGKEIQGIITKVKTSRSDKWTTMYSHNYSFTGNDWVLQNWSTSGSSSWNSYDKWDNIELLYDENSNTAKINSFSELYLVWIFLVIWIIEMLLGSFLLLKSYLRKKEIEDLLQNWKSLKTNIISVRESNIRINRRATYYIDSQAENENDGKIYVFRSELLNFKPWLQVWDTIGVFVNFQNYKKYYVNTKELEEKYVIA